MISRGRETITNPVFAQEYNVIEGAVYAFGEVNDCSESFQKKFFFNFKISESICIFPEESLISFCKFLF